MKRLAACSVILALAAACGTTSARITVTAPAHESSSVGKPIKIVAVWDGECFQYAVIPWALMMVALFPVSWTLLVDWDNAKEPDGGWRGLDAMGPVWERCNQQPFRIDVTCSIKCEALVGAGIGRATTTVTPLEPGVLRVTVVATHTEQTSRRHEMSTEVVVVPNDAALQSTTSSSPASPN